MDPKMLESVELAQRACRGVSMGHQRSQKNKKTQKFYLTHGGYMGV